MARKNRGKCPPGYNPEYCWATSKTTGKQCGRKNKPGYITCRSHGSATAAAHKTAQARLRELQHPAIDQLARIIEDPTTKDQDKLRAIENVLDRTGIPRGNETTLTTAKQTLLETLKNTKEQ